MFTGIVEEQGTLVGLDLLDGDAAQLRVHGELTAQDAPIGASIAVDGVCLTVVAISGGQFTADVMRETLNTTTIAERKPGERVNLERAMRADGRLGGHIVSGHVDGVGTVFAITPAEHWQLVRIGVPRELSRYLAKKGSVTVDGVSLTVTAVGAETEGAHWFEVSLIPETRSATTLGSRAVGDRVNIETDMIAKYVERLLEGGH